MSRLDFVRREWLRCVFGAIVTLLATISWGWENPAGVQPSTLFSCLAFLCWAVFIGIMLITDRAREMFFE